MCSEIKYLRDLAHPCDRLQAAENLLDPLARVLAHPVAVVADGATVDDAARSLVARILCDVRVMRVRAPVSNHAKTSKSSRFSASSSGSVL
jgi:hypothetical protein